MISPDRGEKPTRTQVRVFLFQPPGSARTAGQAASIPVSQRFPMHPIHDVDALLLLATALAAKRRPAEPAEIMAAIDLIQGNIPAEEKLGEAFARLGMGSLLAEADGRVALTAAAEGLIEMLPPKGDHAQRLFELKGQLGSYQPPAAGTAVRLAPEQLRAAILAHRSAAGGTAKNLLVPKPKPETAQARPGQRRRKPMPKQRKR